MRTARMVLGVVAVLVLVLLHPIPRAEAQSVSFERETVASGLEWPVSFAFAPNGTIVYNERLTGRVRLLHGGVAQPGDLGSVPVETSGEQGLLGLALDPRFAESASIYLYHTYFNETLGAAMNRVVRIRVGDPSPSGTQVVFDGIPASTLHNGGVLGFAPDDTLFITTGDATAPARAQDVGSLSGKVLRINRDGSLPPDNPFTGSAVYSMGHRNVFGLAFHPVTGAAYISENGPSRDDEVNRLSPGGNYGWPEVTGDVNDPRYVDPVVTFASVIAPTGLAFYSGIAEPWTDSLFLGDWNRGILQRIRLGPPDGSTFVEIETVDSFPEGILDVEMGPDGFLYVSTPSAIYRLRTASSAPVVPIAVLVLSGLIAALALGWAVRILTRRSPHRDPRHRGKPRTMQL